MILIITHKQDFTADFLINKLNQQSTKYFRLNCEDLLREPKFTISNDLDFKLKIENLQDVTSVWFRRTQIPKMDALNLQERLYFNSEFDSLLENIYCALSDKKWLSDPFNIYKAENKILQLKAAKEMGFVIPKTILSNDKDKIIEFYNNNYKTIIKPLNSGYFLTGQEASLFFTSILTDSDIEKLKETDLTPCIFQNYIEKDYELRITVVGNQVFSAKIDSQKEESSKIDWRRNRMKFSTYNLPEEVKNKCLRVCKRLGINFGAFDIIRNKDEYIFLEVNPNGQWAWIEMETNLKISNAILNYLID